MKNIKEFVKQQYSKVVGEHKPSSSCCGSGSPCQDNFNEDYGNLDGYIPNADYGLGCGLPTRFAQLRPGHKVLDLGSGAGNDCFVARAAVGETGKVYGLDFSEAMVTKARANAKASGYENVEFIMGDIEDMPFTPNSIDVVLSNCVLNLVPDKEKVFSGIFRVLRPGGHFSISDVVTSHTVPAEFNENHDLLGSCVVGALPKSAYLEGIERAGFSHIVIQQERQLSVPAQLANKLGAHYDFKIMSITIYAEKPLQPGSKGSPL